MLTGDRSRSSATQMYCVLPGPLVHRAVSKCLRVTEVNAHRYWKSFRRWLLLTHDDHALLRSLFVIPFTGRPADLDCRTAIQFKPSATVVSAVITDSHSMLGLQLPPQRSSGAKTIRKQPVEGAITDVTMRLSLQHIIAWLKTREVSQRSVGMCCATYHDAPRDDPTSQWPDPLTEGGNLTVVGRRHPCRNCFQLRLVAHPGGLAVQPPHLRENSDGGK